MKLRIFLAILVVTLLGWLVYHNEFSGFNSAKPKKIFDARISYNTSEYRPYGLKFAYQAFKTKAKKGFFENKQKIDSANVLLQGNNNVLIIATPYFLPNQDEIDKMRRFLDEGNSVFLSSFNVSKLFYSNFFTSAQTSQFFYNQYAFPPIGLVDSLSIAMNNADSGETIFKYPGLKTKNDFLSYDEFEAKVIAKDEFGIGQIFDIQVGEGHIYFSQAPMTLSNYFLLHKDNHQFLNLLMNTLETKQKKVIWDRYYEQFRVQRPEPKPNEDKPGDSYLWEVIKKHPPLQWAIVVFLIGAALFLAIYSKRILKPIEILPDSKNNSMLFVNALSGLYWLKQDHKKIAEKLILHFYDKIMLRHRIQPKDIKLENTEKLAQKMNIDEAILRDLLTEIQSIELSEQISKQKLLTFYSKLYKVLHD
jgi:hypothetical protein